MSGSTSWRRLCSVERGGTTTNNHDIKDLWKAHIAPDAHHLFLVVPHANWNAAGASREKPFLRVARRLGAFFGDARREVDVLSLHVFGYGRAELLNPVTQPVAGEAPPRRLPDRRPGQIR